MPNAQPAPGPVHLVEQPGPGARQERRLAPRLPPGDAGSRLAGDTRVHLPRAALQRPRAARHRLRLHPVSPARRANCCADRRDLRSAPRTTPNRLDMTLEAIELETGPAPRASIIMLHGLGADGNDFVPIVARARPAAVGPVRFVFPHAPIQAGHHQRRLRDARLVRHPRRRLTQREDEAGPARTRRPRSRRCIAREKRARHRRRAHRARRLLAGLRDDAADGPAPRRAAGRARRRCRATCRWRPRPRPSAAPPTATCRSSWPTAPDDPVIPIARRAPVARRAARRSATRSSGTSTRCRIRCASEEIADLNALAAARAGRLAAQRAARGARRR